MFCKIKKILSNEYNLNILLNYFFKLLCILLGLVSVRLTISYLGKTLYGLWVTITSIISWMNSGDLGIGNGLRNELAKAYSQGDVEKQKNIINTAFICMAKVAIGLLGIIIFLTEIFIKNNILQTETRLAMYITAVFFCINLVIGISQSIAYSYQKSWLTMLTTCEIQGFTIIALLFLNVVGNNPNLNNFAVLNGICMTIPNVLLLLILKKRNIAILELNNLGKENRELRQSIMNVGVQFFIIQVCGVLLYSTDNIIINKLFGSELVSKYSVITKVYDTGNSLFSIFLVALWSAVTYYAAKDNYKWIIKRVKELLVLWILFTGGVLLVSIGFNSIIRIWLGNETVRYEKQLIVLFGVYCCVSTFSAIFINVLNGLGVIKVQLVLTAIESILNIPLSVIFATKFGMGILGVKLATFLCAVINAVVLPLQVIIILKRRDKRG